MINDAASLLPLQRLYYWEGATPDRVVLTQPMGHGVVKDFTWAQVADQVRRMASHLQAQGWERGSKVAILSKNCAWWLMSDLAIWMAGHVSVPLYPTLTHATIAQILAHSEARACFVGKLDGWEDLKAGIPTGLPCIAYPLSPPHAVAAGEGWDEICARNAPLEGAPLREAQELATLIYTSGTTGQPKGVMHSFGNLAWAIDKGIARVRMTPADRMLSYLPLAHVAERVLVEQGWLRAGLHVFFADSLDTFVADIQRARPTIFFSVPRLWLKFQHAVHARMAPAKLDRLLSIPVVAWLVRRKVLGSLGLDRCHFATGGAAPMPVDLLAWYRRIGLPVNEGYGLTENLAVSHLTVPGLDQGGTVGPPYEGVEARIDLASNEIQMRNGALMMGYYKEPELTREAFCVDGWLRTGDTGQIDDQGVLRITGRLKDLFKTSKGKYIAPAPIEELLVMHDAIEACVVTGANLSQPLGIAMLNAEAVAGLKDPATMAELESSLGRHLQRINEALAPYERLECLVLVSQPWTVENDLITPTFKVKRQRIDAIYAGEFERWESSGRKVIWQTA
jgi:long-chain acyl-CoA synthetase